MAAFFLISWYNPVKFSRVFGFLIDAKITFSSFGHLALSAGLAFVFAPRAQDVRVVEVVPLAISIVLCTFIHCRLALRVDIIP